MIKKGSRTNPTTLIMFLLILSDYSAAKINWPFSAVLDGV